MNEIPRGGGPLNLYKWVYVAEGWGGVVWNRTSPLLLLYSQNIL